MKVFKTLALIAMVSGLAACGSSQPSAIYTSGYGTGVGTQTGGTITQNTGNGTRTVTPVVYGVATTYGTKALSQTATVQAGDLLVLNVSGAQVSGAKSGSILGGVIPTNVGLSGPLSNLTAKLNGAVIANTGSSQVVPVTTSGAVSLEFDSSIVSNLGTNNVTFNVNFASAYGYNGIVNYGGIYVVHCLNTAGQATNCF